MTNTLQPAQSATDAAGDLFLSGNYIELGISSAGNFGANSGQTPAGFVQADPNGVGLVYNEAGFGVDPSIPSIDFFTPGTPYEAFAAGYASGGTNYSGYNYADGGNVDITPTSLTNTSSGSTLSAEWVGDLNSNLRVTIDYSFDAANLYFKTAVTLTNISGSAMDDVRYSREVDPDNTVDAGGSFATDNTIVAQRPTNGASEVAAVSATGDSYYNATGSVASLLYYSTDPNSQVAEGLAFGGGLDPFAATLWAGDPAGSTTGSSDTAIAISYDGGPLAAGASTSFTYYTALTNNIAATVAAIAAANSFPTLAPGSDSGVKGDDVTNVTTPVITGTGGAGDTVALMDGSTPVGTATVGADGTWSITTSPLADGTHSLTAVFTDPSGTFSSSPLSLTIDTTAPTAPASLALDAGSDSGVKGDDLTNVKAPVITGTGEVGDTITLKDGSTVVGTGTVGADGTWSVTTSPLADGVHTLIATEADPAGNVSPASSSLPLTIDTSAPAAPGSLSLAPASDSGVKGDDLTNVKTPVITGTGVAGDTIALMDGSSSVGTATVGADGTWSITSSSLADGTHALTATETDPAGNVSASSTAVAVKIDTTNPAPTITLESSTDSGVVGDGITNDATPTLTGTAEPGSTVALIDDSTGSPIVLGTAVADGSGNWSYSLGLPVKDGTYSITATSTDAAGNVSPSSPFALTIDTVAPTAPTGLTLDPASDSGVKGDDLTNVKTPVITGTGVAGDTITLMDGETAVGTGTVGADGTWSVTTGPLADGAHTLAATETDPAGNVSLVSTGLPLTIDTSEPAPASLALEPASDSGIKGDDLTNVKTPVITGTGVAGDTITLMDGEAVVGSGTVGADGTWSVTTGPLADGAHTLAATETDPAGNISPATDPLALTIDTTAPSAPASLALDPGSDTGIKGDDITSDQTPTLTGVAAPGSTVTFYDGSGPDAIVLGTTTVGTDGQWRFTPSTPLAAGTHNLTATATDAAGNQSGPSSGFALTIDIPSPPMGIGLDPASDSGVPGDGFTNDARPTLVGSATPGSTVTISSNLGVIGTVTADASGNWSYLYGLPVADGAYSITATSTDAAGNVSASSMPFALTIDTTTPTAPASPALNGNYITNIPTPVITGTGEAGDTITLMDGSTVVGTGTVGADGTWSVTTSPLTVFDGTTTIATGTIGADGPWSMNPVTSPPADINTLTATQTDAAGNISAASTQANMLVVQAPVAGVSVTDVSSADIGAALAQGYQLSFIPGTEAVLLTDATLSVGPDTNEATIQRLYEGLLGRSNDTGGISFFDAQLASGVSKATVATEIISSNEYITDHGTQTDQQFVTSLYQGLLGRAPDPTGLAAWTSALAQGASRGDVAVGIADSSEAKSYLAPTTAQVYVPNAAGTLVHELFETGLGREVEVAALPYYQAAYLTQTPSQIAAAITASPEFQADHVGQSNAAYVTSLYEDGLGRAPDAAGLTYWTAALDSGAATRSDVLLGIATSSEATAHLTHNLSA